MYFDDATIQDWSSANASGQALVRRLMKLVGTPFASDKQQAMASQGLFLGLTHDLTEAASHHRVRCWIRERLAQDITYIIVTAEKSSSLSPGMAAKLYGCVNFFELGVFGRVARGGLNAIKDRQYSRDTQLSSELRRAFHMILALVDLRPERVVHLGPRLSHRFVAASDAAWELSSGGGSGGYLLVLDPGLATESRLARVASLPLSLYR